MKKSFIKIITILFISFVSWGCTTKEVLTPNAFAAILKNNGFDIVNLTEQYKNNNDIKNVYIGKSNKGYQIEYFILKDEETASNLLNENASEITNSINTTQTKREGDNYLKYIFVSNEYYFVVSKVDNTLIYVEASLDNQEEINNLLEQMNY